VLGTILSLKIYRIALCATTSPKKKIYQNINHSIKYLSVNEVMFQNKDKQ